MTSPHIPLSLLFRLLPRTAELAGLREAILAGSSSDPRDEWIGSASYSTLDRRVISEQQLAAVFSAAEARSMEHVRTYHRSLRAALTEVARHTSGAALAEMQRLGEEAASEGRWELCISYYGVVAGLAQNAGDAPLTILAQRRMGRAHLHLGHPARAARWYQQSLHTAEEHGDREGAIIAHVGLGHACAVEGRFIEADAHYRRSLELGVAADPKLTAHAAINLSMTARETHRLEEAHSWLQRARERWDRFDPAERSVWHNNAGLLALAEGRIPDARAAFEEALADAPSHHDRAMVLDNLAESYVRTGELDQAEDLARTAEEFAIGGASARALADIYIRLGRIMRARRDENGVAFFEKAIQLCQENGYLFTEAVACTEYALYRTVFGDREEAQGLSERAESLLKRLETPITAE